EVVRLPDPKLKTLGEEAVNASFLDMLSILRLSGSMFSLVPRPSQRSLKDGTEDSGGSVVSERVTKEVVQQPKSELKKSKRHRTPKDFGPEFQLYLIEGTKDEISDQYSYFFNK
nr:zinc finger, CCHC-type [Tanacetum cinerariifolium]